MFSILDLDTFFNINVDTPSTLAWVSLGVSIMLLVCSGLASASEIAFFSLTPQHLSEISEGRRPSDFRILELRERGDRHHIDIEQSGQCCYHHVTELLLYGLAQFWGRCRVAGVPVAYCIAYIPVTLVWRDNAQDLQCPALIIIRTLCCPNLFSNGKIVLSYFFNTDDEQGLYR